MWTRRPGKVSWYLVFYPQARKIVLGHSTHSLYRTGFFPPNILAQLSWIGKAKRCSMHGYCNYMLWLAAHWWKPCKILIWFMCMVNIIEYHILDFCTDEHGYINPGYKPMTAMYMSLLEISYIGLRYYMRWAVYTRDLCRCNVLNLYNSSIDWSQGHTKHRGSI